MLAMALVMGATGSAAAAASPAPGGTAAPVAMTIRTVGALQGQNVVLLEGGGLVLPIWIGSIEAAAIDQRLHGMKPPRPLTHDLLEATLAALHAKVERVEVIDLRDTVFIGRLTVRDGAGTTHVIDARPSDLCSLAVGANLPMMVAPHVLREAGLDATTLQPPKNP
jgi:bifunctional DNase/RNase